MTQELQLLYLLKEDAYISTGEIMGRIPNSEKTLRTRMKALDEMLQAHGARVQSKRGAGYCLVVENREQFEEWSRYPYQEKGMTLPDNGTDRVTYILSVLFNRDGYIKREELAEFLCVSEKTISTDIRQAEFILKQYDLQIERRPSYGMRILGDEFKKRQCILNQLILMNPSDLFRKELEERKAETVGRIIKEVTAEYHMNIPELPFQNLIYYLLVTEHRIRYGWEITGEECVGWKKEVGIYQVSKAILDGLKRERILTDYREGEVYLTSLFLWGNRVVENQYQTTVNYVIPARVEELAGNMIRAVYEEFQIDFRGDLNLRMCLINHLASLDVRMRHGIHITNPHLQEIREKYFFAYLIAEQASCVVNDYYGKAVPEDEIGFFALLFAMKLKEDPEKRKMNILLFCATGKIGSQFLKFRLEEEFREYINEIDMRSIYEIESIDFLKYDYVFTTLPIDRPVPVPILMIHDFFDSAEILKIHQEITKHKDTGEIQNFYRRDLFFPEVPGETREEVLKWMCAQITRRTRNTETMEELVLERERLGGTDFGNLAAMPHPLRKVSDENLVSVGILNTPILWEKNKVQLVILASVSQTRSGIVQKFISRTSHLLLNEEAVKRILQEKSYEQLIKELLSVVG